MRDKWLVLKCVRSKFTELPSTICVNVNNISVIDTTFCTLVLKDGSYWTTDKSSISMLIKNIDIEGIDFVNIGDLINTKEG